VHAQGLARLVLPGIGRDHRDDAVGLGKRQPLEQAAVDDAEHRRAEADAEAQRQN
jgi:hypothetical protein